jgi:hypothetical protein
MSKETEGTKAHGIKAGLFFQCSMMELATEEQTMKIGNRVINIGPTESRGTVVNIFQTGRPDIFNAINSALLNEIANNTLVIMVKAAEPDVKPVCKLYTYAQPGLALGYSTQDEEWVNADKFDFYEHRIDVDGIEKARIVPSIDRATGKWLENTKRVINTGRVFLFGNDFDTFKSIVKEQIDNDRKFIVKPEQATTPNADTFKEIPAAPTIAPVTEKVTV